MSLKNMKIGPQIMLVTFFIAIITIVGLSATSIHYFSNYTNDALQESVHYGMVGIKNTIREEMERVDQFRDQLAQTPMIANFVYSRDTVSLNEMLLPLMRAANIDFAIVTDRNGKVISRPHDPEQIGDDLGRDETVRMSLDGRTWHRIMPATSPKLGYYTGTPIKMPDGTVIGMIQAAISLEDETIVDKIKETYGIEATIFAGPTRINTTLTQDGKRVLGTDAEKTIQRDVLEGGTDAERAINLFGSMYSTVYSPLKDPETGKILGMYFCGKSMEDAAQANRTMIMTVVLIAVLVFVLAFIIAMLTARRISKPLGQIVMLAERCRSGDFTIRREDFRYDGGGELGALVEAFSEMISAQSKAMSQVVLTANEVAEQTDALNTLSAENASAMSTSASLIQNVSGLCDNNVRAVEISASNVTEMSSGADLVAKMSTESADSLAKTTQMSKNAVNSVNGLVDDIKLVDGKTAENQEKIRVLTSSVENISDFMAAIRSIADQTNLLALNAAIEAARAGDAGRGFAVVAEEVRKLAEESRKASSNVEELVTLLGQNANEAIETSEQSVAIVGGIMTKADEAVRGLNSALSEITNANEVIQSIAAVAQEQAASSAEIQRAIDEIKQSSEEISETLTELNRLSEQATDIGSSVSNSAQQMARSAVDLKDVLALFRI